MLKLLRWFGAIVFVAGTLVGWLLFIGGMS